MTYSRWRHDKKVHEAKQSLEWVLYMHRKHLKEMILQEQSQLMIAIQNRNPGDEFVLLMQKRFDETCERLKQTNYHEMNELRHEHAKFIQKLNSELES